MAEHGRPELQAEAVADEIAGWFGAAAAATVREVRGGSWSQCFAFDAPQPLIVKFSAHDDDLTTDRVAATFADHGIPVPRVHRHGRALGYGYQVADRADGVPLETVTPAQWQAVVPQLAPVLRTMFTDAALVGSGWGGWDADRVGGHPTWIAFLRSSTTDPGVGRVAGWHPKLDMVPGTRALFDWSVATIDEIVSTDPAAAQPPRGLLHCDMLYRNVHVDVSGDGGAAGDEVGDATGDGHARLAAIFDWGCSVYGDPLYELGWFEFWHPWYPQLDPAALFAAMSEGDSSLDPSHPDNHGRWMVALLHIGATHLAYQAFVDMPEELSATADRLRVVARAAGLTPPG